MANYTFQNLSPFDFEMLCKEIIEYKTNKQFEAFTIGRDGGTDLRYIEKTKKIIVQCKHYEKTGYNGLKTNLKNEKKSVTKLNPSKYIIMTSVGLTPDNKDELKSLLSPFIKKTSDIIGATEINAILNKNESIIRHHFKLWMMSAGVIDQILHNSIYKRSEINKESIEHNIKIYVKNNFYNKALRILEEKSICIISGIPGIGKTSMAEMLAYQMCCKNYEFYSINNIAEVLTILNEPRKRVFYYDDFLGATQYEDKNEYKDFQKVIQYILKRNDTKLILTTREYIYQQGLSKSEKLAQLDLNSNILQLSDYTQYDKALILYNHLYYFSVPQNLYNYLIKDKHYLKIINHKNYSPRLIEWLVTSKKIETIQDGEEYYKVFMDSLDNPAQVWKKTFENNISECSRFLLYCLCLAGKLVETEKLGIILKQWLKVCGVIKSAIDFEILFKNSLKELENSFISIQIQGTKNYITLHNPSIEDFLTSRLSVSSEIIREYSKLPILFWDQKINILEKLPEEDRETIFYSMVENITLAGVKAERHNNIISTIYHNKTKKLNYIIQFCDRNKLTQPTLKKVSEIVLSYIYEQDYIGYDLLQYVKYLSSQGELNKLKGKFINLFDNIYDTYELNNCIELNNIIAITTKEKLRTKAMEVLQNAEIELSSYDYDRLVSLQGDLDNISKELHLDCSDLYEEVNEKIGEYEAYVESKIDYEMEERDFSFGDESNEINLLFSSLRQ